MKTESKNNFESYYPDTFSKNPRKLGRAKALFLSIIFGVPKFFKNLTNKKASNKNDHPNKNETKISLKAEEVLKNTQKEKVLNQKEKAKGSVHSNRVLGASKKRRKKTKKSEIEKFRKQHGEGLAAIPEEPITVGLPNLAVTCWLNATMKLLATTDAYDKLLTADILESKSVPENKKKLLQKLQIDLRCIVNALRKNHGIPKEFYKNVARCIRKTLEIDPDRQQDAAEFLEILSSKICFSSKNQVKKVKLYEEEGVDPAFIKYGLEPEPENSVTVDVFSEEEINLQEALQNKSALKARPDAVKDRNASWNTPVALGQNRHYTQKTRYTHLPGKMLLKINRAYIDKAFEEKKNNRPILFKKDNLIELIEYKEERDSEGHITDAKEHRRCFYQIKASIVHRGKGGSRGHYICYTRDKKGSFWLHNDTQVEKQEDTQVKKKAARGYLFYLEKVHEELIEPSSHEQEADL